MSPTAVTDPRRDDLSAFITPFRITPGATVSVARDCDSGFTAGMKEKSSAGRLDQGVQMLSDYQSRLAAEGTRGVLIVLQALDAAGKDGTIRHVMSGVNPQGVSVHSFKQPSTEELSHDYLWRYQQRLPAQGEIAIFNRSHYEEVLVVRVHPENLDRERIPAQTRGKALWERRFTEINAWERYLVDNGVHVIKLFLNISKEEQRIRLLRRCDLPDHNWKLSMSDVTERDHWAAYEKAFSEMLSHTSTPWAPWYVIPADHKWFARIAVSSVIVEALMAMDPQFPTLDAVGRAQLAEARAALEAQAPPGVKSDARAR